MSNFNKKIVLDVMLDVETLGNESKPLLVQLAAVAFDINTGKTFEEYDELIDPWTSVKAGLQSTGSCLDWWFTQDKAVFTKIVMKAIQSGKPLDVVLKGFADYIEKLKKDHNAYAVKVWGNGMDNAWLFDSYYACKMPTPYPFWDCNDLRSIVDIGNRIFNHNPKKTMVFEGEKHNAIDDDKHQIRYLIDILRKMKEAGMLPPSGK